MEEKEFYDLMKEKVNEINSLDVPEDYKKKLYLAVEETIQRHEGNRRTAIETLSSVSELEKGLVEKVKIEEKMRKSMDEIQKSLDNSSNILTALKIIRESRN